MSDTWVFVTYEGVRYEVPSTSQTYEDARIDFMNFLGLEEERFLDFEVTINRAACERLL